jgi:hypothetical protein
MIVTGGIFSLLFLICWSRSRWESRLRAQKFKLDLYLAVQTIKCQQKYKSNNEPPQPIPLEDGTRSLLFHPVRKLK